MKVNALTKEVTLTEVEYRSLALTWEDIKTIHNIIGDTLAFGPLPNIETLYQVVLKRFNEQREKK